MRSAVEALKPCFEDDYRLVVVLGAGAESSTLSAVSLEHPSRLKKKYRENELWLGDDDVYKNPRHGEGADEWVWDSFEAFRLWTARGEIPRIQFVLGQLALWGYVDSVISLNYTRYLDHFFEREEERLRVARNPVLDPDENSCWGYYSSKQTVPDPSDGGPPITYWKIHGDIGYASCRTCREQSPSHVFRLPPFPVSNRIQNILRFVQTSSIETQVHHPLVQLTPDGKPFKSQDLHPSGALQHHVDWDSYPDRRAFARECEGAEDTLRDALNRDSTLVWLVGFTGHWSENPYASEERNEELVPIIRDAISRGESHRLWMSLARPQYLAARDAKFADKPLVEALRKENRLEQVEDWDELAGDLYAAAPHTHAPLEAEYGEWTGRWIR